MPYADRWSLVATKVSAGVFTVTRPDTGASVTLQPDHVLGTDALNGAAVLFRAIQHLYPDLPDLWANRYDYAVARWKISAYAAIATGQPKAIRDALTVKSNVWVAEEVRLKTLMGADA